MRIPVNKMIGALKAGASAKRESDVPVRVSVFVDEGASPFLIDAVRRAFVPATTSGLVRVERLGAEAAVKPDTDISLVLAGGSPGLREAVQRIAIGGAPTAVLAESCVEVPFITGDTPLLGLIAATDEGHLLDALARWILERTEKRAAFAANFPFMREAAAGEVIASTALANAVTGALAFVPGADYPVMTLAQLGMMVQLALIYGRPLKPERGYEAAAVVLSGLVLRAAARQVAKPAGRAAFLVKAAAGGVGTYAMGRALAALYERDMDYARMNGAVADALGFVRALVRDVRGAHAGEAAPVAGGEA